MDRRFVEFVFYVVTTALCGGIIRVFVPPFLPIAVLSVASLIYMYYLVNRSLAEL